MLAKLKSYVPEEPLARALLVGAFCALTFHPAVQAALPAPPTTTPVTGTNFIDWIRDYGGIALALLAMLLCAGAFVNVAWGALATYSDYRAGKAELGTLKMQILVGIVLLGLVFILGNQAVLVLPTSAGYAGGGGNP